MNIFEFAMKMEMDGKTFYETSASSTEDPGLKSILLELASDEQKHFDTFKAMSDGQSVDSGENSKTSILTSTKNLFEKLSSQENQFSFSSNARNIWVEAREIEKKTEEFYLAKADEVKDPHQKEILIQIADEEHKHWCTLEAVVRFIDSPDRYLEDAEWNDIEGL